MYLILSKEAMGSHQSELCEAVFHSMHLNRLLAQQKNEEFVESKRLYRIAKNLNKSTNSWIEKKAFCFFQFGFKVWKSDYERKVQYKTSSSALTWKFFN